MGHPFPGAGIEKPFLLLLMSIANLYSQTGTLIWNDEFDGPAGSPPDPAKWTVQVMANPPNNEAQYYTGNARNASLNGQGQLELTALLETMGTKAYTSGRIYTSGKFQRQFGYFEARARLPAGQGMWPAFWLLGVNNGCGGWPNCGEIDIMEFRGRLPRASTSAMHGPGYSGNTPLVGNHNLPSAAPSFTEDFHIFAADWTTNQVRFFVDGVLHYTVTRANVQPYGNWVFDRPFYIILNLAVGGNFDGGRLPPNSALPAKAVFDHVRVYSAPPTALATPGERVFRRGDARLLIAPAGAGTLPRHGISGAPESRAVNALGRVFLPYAPDAPDAPNASDTPALPLH